MPKWKRLGSGSYNTAYKSNDGREVLKTVIPHPVVKNF